MANRKDFFFRERVTEAELDSAFADLEDADHNLAADLGFVGVLANAVVSPHAPVPNLTVDISGPGIALDQQGQRIFFSALQNANVAQDDNAVSTEVTADGKEKIVSIFVKFDRSLSDPRIDGNSQTVFFRRDEAFKFVVVQGAEAAAGQAAAPPALRSDALLLADVVRRFGQAQIGAEAISTARRQDAFVIAGAPRSIRRGLTEEAVSDLLGFYNAHVGGTADRHPAAAIDYAGGNAAWADGAQNPATTVEAQIDKIIADLATAGGAAKIGAAATAGASGALAAGSVKSQLDALLGLINGHVTVAAGAHPASTIAYAAGTAWKDGTPNPAATVKAQLDKLVSDLVADAGASRIGVGTRANWLDGGANPAGVSILAALSKIINDLSEHSDVADGAARIGAQTSGTLPAGSVRSQLDALNASAVRTNAANVFSATQTVNGTADEKVPVIATTVAPAQPAQRKLLWEIAGDSYKYRVYAALFDFEITANARWDGAQWVRDAAAFASSKLDFNTNFFRLNSTDANNAPIGDSWPNSFTAEMIGHGHQVIDQGGNLRSPGATETYISYLGPSNNVPVGSGAPFRKVFPAQPSSITFTMLNSRNVASGPFGFFPTPIGTAAFVGGVIGQPDVQFACHVLAT